MKAKKAVPPAKPSPKRPVKRRLKSVLRRTMKQLGRLARRAALITNTPLFGMLYAGFAILTLAGTTILWSTLGARINTHNADQLVNPLLFEKADTLHEALIPASHSFILKWPVFYLIKLLGYSNGAYVSVTVLLALLTVGLLAGILYRIDRRPLVYGTVILALASVLLLIPSSAYTGALLPVNMAMIATRNIEYIWYIAGLYLVVRTKHIRSWSFWSAVILFAVLMASDKLFVSLALGGAIIALMVYGLARGWNLVSTASRWILAVLLGISLSTITLFVLSARHVVSLAGQGGLGPYGIAHSVHDLALGAAYAVLHLLTNMGANPAAQTMLLRNIPHDSLHALTTSAGLSYCLNMCLMIFALYAVFHIIHSSLAHNKDAKQWLNHPAKLAAMLVWTTLAALAVFVLSNHYYAADARYLGIALFCLIISAATYISRRSYHTRWLVGFGSLLMVGLLLAIPAVLHTYHQDQAALAPFTERNGRIASVLTQHPVKILVGDYWRVVPLKTVMQHQAVMPMASCTQPRDSLTSRAWMPDLSKTSFAYILSLDASLTDFPHCTLDQVTAFYGHPNASVVIEGTVTHPKELVLFYDSGKQKSNPGNRPAAASTVQPIDLDQLSATSCRQPTIMNIVAHQDDDLLFINPDTFKDLQAGNCMRTVYVTAGDAGSNAFYWLRREQASQGAYAKMIGRDNSWVQRTIHLADDEYASIANPRGNNKVSLIYLHLPDGNLHGQGFASHNNESLALLESGKISTIHDVYSGSSYTLDQLENALTELMQSYQPTEIRTQAHVISDRYPDHSDHMAVGILAQKAYQKYETEHFANQTVIPIKYYIGYPIHARAPNLTPQDQNQKEQIFSIYSNYDGAVCHSIMRCRYDPAYGYYLSREYQDLQ